MEKMEIYESCRSVPENAKKPITAGRLKGKTDINPMWRIKCLTEMFGPCGIGWWYVIKEQRIIPAGTDEVAAFVDIDLYYRKDDQVSAPIPGTGGASFVAKEKNGLYVSDECFKMALTDAISVACKALGMGADVYWDGGTTKYSQPEFKRVQDICCDACGMKIVGLRKGGREVKTAEEVINWTKEKFGRPLCWGCAKPRADNEVPD